MAGPVAIDASKLGFDTNALREKHRRERDRRRPDRDEQFVPTRGAFAAYSDQDPYTAPGSNACNALLRDWRTCGDFPGLHLQ